MKLCARTEADGETQVSKLGKVLLQTALGFCSLRQAACSSRIASALMRNVFSALAGLSVCLLSPFLGAVSSEEAQGGSMKISSDAFAANETIPKKFTCDGPDASPKLNWSEPPAKTQSFALIMDDP